MARRIPPSLIFFIVLGLILSAAYRFTDVDPHAAGPRALRALFTGDFSPEVVDRPRIAGMAREHYLNASAPLPAFRDALMPGVKYMSIGLGGGLANEIISTMHLLLVSRMSNRIPILHDFTRDWTHLPETPGEDRSKSSGLPVSDLFNLDLYTDVTSYPILQWRDVKLSTDHVPDHTSCYEALDKVDRIVGAAALRGNQATDGDDDISVEVWSAPGSPTVDIHKMSNLVEFLGDWPARQEHSSWLLNKWEEGEVGIRTEDDPDWTPTKPEDQFACWSEMYYFYTDRFDERWETTWPAWRQIGVNLPFADPLLKIVAEYREAIVGDWTSQYIAIHARHGDFGRGTPASTYLPHVTGLLERHPDLKSVIVFSDEVDPEWWDGVAAQGWLRANHDAMGTVEKHGVWYPTIIDMVLLSESHAFIGTYSSTFSLLAKLRVQEYQGGEIILV